MEKEKNKKIQIRPSSLFPIAPARQFKKLIITAFVIGLCIIVLHMYLFYRVNSSDIFGVRSTDLPAKPSINEAKLKSVLTRFAEKETKRGAAESLTPTVADPSQ